MQWMIKAHDVLNVAGNPTRTLLPASFVLSFLSLSLTPSFISLIFTLTTLLLYTRATLKSSHPILKGIALWLTLTASISLSHIQPSIHALSTTSASVLSLILLSGVSSAIALVPVYLRHKFTYVESITFPSLWAATWLLASWLSPIGRLITWTPLSGISSYRWILPFLGFSGLDWIAAAWASVAAETLGHFLVDHKEETILLPEIDSIETREHPEFRLPRMTGLLMALAIPSFFVTSLPLPSMSASTTPLRVACILPEPSESSQLDRFLRETRSHASSAKVLLWPEGAVTFETRQDREEALDAVEQIAATSKIWVGVSFDERVSGTGRGNRDGQRRNGMALVGPEGVEMTYYKRVLVPIAESFSQLASNESPIIHVIDLPRPPGWRKGDWGPSDTRPIPLSASICLDFSVPLTSLESRPALVLAPAKTWHTGVGHAMYELARARGEEIGADVLWCDGGAGGLSGVADGTQVGTGSWVKTIGVPYPFPEGRRRTVYGFGGDWLALAAVFGVPALLLAARHNAGHIEDQSRDAITWAGERVRELVARVRRVGHREAPQPAPLIET